MFSKLSRRTLLAAGLPLLLTGCTRLGAFNAVVSFDEGTKLLGDGLSFGPHDRQKLDLYGPAKGGPAEGGPAPLVVFLYGGSWNSGRRQDYAFVGHALAAAGFYVAIPDYRLVPEVTYPAFLEDNAAALAWCLAEGERFGAETNKVFLAGHSAGAYNAVMLGLAPEFLEPHGLTPDRIAGIAGLAGPYDFLPLKWRATKRAFAGASDLEATQPVNRVGPDAPPLFLASGEDDSTVLPKNSANLAQAARAAGVPVVEKRYPDIGHAGLLLALSKPLRDSAPVLADMTAFLRA
ncbi:MAG: alpha/beta hydrolase [Limibacillus sp.]|jgi:acetyl esterase/lipase